MSNIWHKTTYVALLWSFLGLQLKKPKGQKSFQFNVRLGIQMPTCGHDISVSLSFHFLFPIYSTSIIFSLFSFLFSFENVLFFPHSWRQMSWWHFPIVWLGTFVIAIFYIFVRSRHWSFNIDSLWYCLGRCWLPIASFQNWSLVMIHLPIPSL